MKCLTYEECQKQLPPPTIKDAILGNKHCPNCGRYHQWEKGEQEALVASLITRLEALELASEALITEHVVEKASPEILTSFKKKQQKRNRRNEN